MLDEKQKDTDEYVNGVKLIAPIRIGISDVRPEHLLNDMIIRYAPGIHISSVTPYIDIECNTYSSMWEVFDPELVEYPDELPEHWQVIYGMHNEPSRRDCVYFRFRYVHTPVDMIPSYPDVPRKGIFVIDDMKRQNGIEGKNVNELKGSDLIWIGCDVDDDILKRASKY